VAATSFQFSTATNKNWNRITTSYTEQKVSRHTEGILLAIMSLHLIAYCTLNL